jgi:hypothetical protein
MEEWLREVREAKKQRKEEERQEVEVNRGKGRK